MNRNDERCEEEYCYEPAIFNFEGFCAGLFCSKHKLDEMVQVVFKKEEEEETNTSTLQYDLINLNQKKFGNVSDAKCEEEFCFEPSTFNFPGFGVGVFCVRHKLDCMVAVVKVEKNRSEKENLRRKKGELMILQDRSQGFRSEESENTFVSSEHITSFWKGKTSKNIPSTQCHSNNCELPALFNFKGELEGVFCFFHKLESMVNVKKQKRSCEHKDCHIRPTFGVKESRPRFCATHRLPGMVFVAIPRCRQEGCKEIPIYGKKRRAFCETHKLSGMKFIKIKGVQCLIEDCHRYALYNDVNKPKRYCSKHKSEHMVVDPTMKCRYQGCYLWPSFNYEGSRTAKFCANHQLSGMILLPKNQNRNRKTKYIPKRKRETAKLL